MDSKKPAAAVPKFASFKQKRDDTPKPSPPESEPKPRPGKEHSRRDRVHGRDRDRDRDSQDKLRGTHTKSHSQHRHHDRQRTRSASPERAPLKPTSREDPLYIVDKRGDPMILRYGSNERFKVPSYRRFGAGRLIGANGRIKLIYDGPQELFSLGNKPGEGPSVFRDRALISKASMKKTRVFRLRPEPEQKQAQAFEDELDFLPLSGSRKALDLREDSHDVLGSEAPNYRSISGKAKARDFVDSDLDSADTSESDAEVDIDSTNPVKQRSIELSRHVKEHPENVEAWLEFVDIQEPLLRLNEDVHPDRTADEARGLSSIRLGLLEEALPHATNEADKERLLLRLMHEGSKAWSKKVLSKRWADINIKNSSFALWKAHLDNELANMSTFTYSSLQLLHVKRLQHLQQRLSDTISAGEGPFDYKHIKGADGTERIKSDVVTSVCEEIAYVFLRLTCFIRDSGYSELAVAAWQATLELTFARPEDDPEAIHAETVSSFRDFWESEVSRLGEEGAKGWRHFTEAEEMSDLPEAKIEAAPTKPQTRDLYKAWAAVEAQRSQCASLPARTLDEGTEEDPFRVVMFADLEPLLFWLPCSLNALPGVTKAVVYGFLLFCQLPAPPWDTGGLLQSAHLDPFIYRESVRLSQNTTVDRSGAEDGGKKTPRFFDPGHRFVASADTMFSTLDWFRLFDHETSPEHNLALTATMQLATMIGHGSMAGHSLGLSWTKNPSAIKKAAKALLRKWPNDTRLYCTYAVAEWRNGNQDVAKHVLMSATGQDLSDKAQLWNTWAWLELEAGHLTNALSRCINAVGISSDHTQVHTTYAELLKARQTLSSRCEFCLSTGDIQQAAAFAALSAMMEYLSHLAGATESTARQGDIKAAMVSIQTFISEAVPRGHGSAPSLELLLQFAAHLLFLHADRGVFQPNYIREQFHIFVCLFPNNTIFLSLFAWADTSLLLNDPVRNLLRSRVLAKSNDCITSRLFAIQHEMHSFGSIHSVRTAFERALDSDACKGNAGLWISYLRFCAKHHKELRGQAKDVYYRALSACPWSKALALEAFTTLLRDMESSELRAVWNTMSTKGLRMCVDLDEFTADWAKTSRKTK